MATTEATRVPFIDFRGVSGGTVQVYDLDAIVLVVDGPPTLVVGTETCILGLHLGGQIPIGMSASLVLETLGIDESRCLRLTNPQTGLPFHIPHPEHIMVVAGTPNGSTILIRDFGVLVAKEPPEVVREAISSWVAALEVAQ